MDTSLAAFLLPVRIVMVQIPPFVNGAENILFNSVPCCHGSQLNNTSRGPISKRVLAK